MWSSIRAGYVLMPFVALGAVGCSDGVARVSKPIAPVSGLIRLNGSPLSGATVTFHPVSEQGAGNLPASFGKTDADGKYSLEVITNGKPGALIGQHIVRINHPDDKAAAAQSKDIEDAGDAARKAPRKIPERYSTGDQFKFDVPPGGATDADFELKSP